MSDPQEIRDFEKNTEETPRVSIRERRRQSAAKPFLEHEQISMLILFAAIVAAISSVLVGVLALHIPAIVCCAVIFLEMAIAGCLLKVPVWLHVAVVAIQLAAGLWQKKLVLMLLGILVYLLFGYAFRHMRRQY